MRLSYRCKENCGNKKGLSSRTLVVVHCIAYCFTKFGLVSYEWQLLEMVAKDHNVVDMDSIIAKGWWNIWFLALLCATAQQSYCRHAGVRRPSVKPVFSEPVRYINAKFVGKVPFHHISRPFFFLFCFSKFCIFDFLRFFFRFR